MGDELLDSQLGPVQVTPGHTHTTDVQFTRHTDRDRLPLLVQYIDLDVGQRTANDRLTQHRLHLASRGIHRTFGWTVDIVVTRLGTGSQYLPDLPVEYVSSYQYQCWSPFRPPSKSS